MARRAWSCPRCHTALGLLTVDRDGGEHLKAYADRIARLEPDEPGVSTLVWCQCGECRVFLGVAVHLEAKKAA